MSSRNSRHTTEQIVNKLRQADVELAKGQSISAACKTIGITDQTYDTFGPRVRSTFGSFYTTPRIVNRK